MDKSGVFPNKNISSSDKINKNQFASWYLPFIIGLIRRAYMSRDFFLLCYMLHNLTSPYLIWGPEWLTEKKQKKYITMPVGAAVFTENLSPPVKQRMQVTAMATWYMIIDSLWRKPYCLLIFNIWPNSEHISGSGTQNRKSSEV